MSTEILVARFQALPPAAQRQVEALVEALAATQTKSQSPGRKRFQFDWAGGLEDLKGEFTSVELQHQINAWR